MKKLMLALVAGCMSAAVAGAYAAQGSPADTDKAGRAGPGTAAGQMGAADPSPGKAGGSDMSKGSMSKGGSGSMSKGGSSAGMSTGAGAGSTAGATSGGSSAAASSGGMSDEGKSTKRSRRAARASKG